MRVLIVVLLAAISYAQTDRSRSQESVMLRNSPEFALQQENPAAETTGETATSGAPQTVADSIAKAQQKINALTEQMAAQKYILKQAKEDQLKKHKNAVAEKTLEMTNTVKALESVAEAMLKDMKKVNNEAETSVKKSEAALKKVMGKDETTEAPKAEMTDESKQETTAGEIKQETTGAPEKINQAEAKENTTKEAQKQEPAATTKGAQAADKQEPAVTTKEAQAAKKDAKTEKTSQAAETTNGDFSYDNLFDANQEVNVATNHVFDEVATPSIRGEETLGFKFYTLMLLEVITLFVSYNLWQQNKALHNTNYRFDLLENQEF